MSISDIYCCECGKEFSWIYREDIVKHRHRNKQKKFYFILEGKKYFITLKMEKEE
jgi:hypothetical protein